MAGRMNAQDALERAIDEANATILPRALNHVRGDITLGDLIAAMSASELEGEFQGLTLRKFLENLSGGKSSGATRGPGRPRGSTSAKPSTPTKGSAKARNTRTKEGRQAYDTDVLSLLGGVSDSVGASYIRASVGGSGMQARESLKRLIDAGMVRKSGQARSTSYRLA